MVSEKKKQAVKTAIGRIDESPVVGVLNMHNMPARQLFEIRNKLRGNATIMVMKKRLLKRAMDNAKKDVKGLESYIEGEPGMILGSVSSFKLAKLIAQSKSKAAAKEGDIAPEDIVIKEGPTNLPPGPAIGDLQKAKIPAGVEGDKIVVKKDTVVAKKGDEITKDMANLLMKLEIEPMQIGLNLMAAHEDGVIYDSGILFVPPEHYIEELRACHSRSFNLSISVNLVTPDTIPFLISKAAKEATSLADSAGIIVPENVGRLLARAKAAADALASKVGD